MTLTEYRELEQGSDEWLAARLGIVTASVVGKFITPKTVKVASNDESRGLTAQLVAERITGWADPTYMNADMARGHDVEPIARDWYAERYAPVTELGFMVREFTTDTEEPWTYRIGYSPDGLVGTDGLIEVKAPRAKTHLQTHVVGKVPLHHMAQIQAGLLVADRQWCDFISFYCGMPPFIQRVHRDEEWGDVIRDAVEKFELAATEMQADYATATTGIPTTERLLIDMEMVV
jgi:hypothetical protein